MPSASLVRELFPFVAILAFSAGCENGPVPVASPNARAGDTADVGTPVGDRPVSPGERPQVVGNRAPDEPLRVVLTGIVCLPPAFDFPGKDANAIGRIGEEIAGKLLDKLEADERFETSGGTRPAEYVLRPMIMGYQRITHEVLDPPITSFELNLSCQLLDPESGEVRALAQGRSWVRDVEGDEERSAAEVVETAVGEALDELLTDLWEHARSHR